MEGGNGKRKSESGNAALETTLNRLRKKNRGSATEGSAAPVVNSSSELTPIVPAEPLVLAMTEQSRFLCAADRILRITQLDMDKRNDILVDLLAFIFKGQVLSPNHARNHVSRFAKSECANHLEQSIQSMEEHMHKVKATVLENSHVVQLRNQNTRRKLAILNLRAKFRPRDCATSRLLVNIMDTVQGFTEAPASALAGGPLLDAVVDELFAIVEAALQHAISDAASKNERAFRASTLGQADKKIQQLEKQIQKLESQEKQYENQSKQAEKMETQIRELESKATEYVDRLKRMENLEDRFRELEGREREHSERLLRIWGLEDQIRELETRETQHTERLQRVRNLESLVRELEGRETETLAKLEKLENVAAQMGENERLKAQIEDVTETNTKLLRQFSVFEEQERKLTRQLQVARRDTHRLAHGERLKSSNAHRKLNLYNLHSRLRADGDAEGQLAVEMLDCTQRFTEKSDAQLVEPSLDDVVRDMKEAIRAYATNSRSPTASTSEDTLQNDSTQRNGDTRKEPMPQRTQVSSAVSTRVFAATRTRRASATGAAGTLIVYQPTCLDHHNGAHQENRARLTALCGPNGILQRNRYRSLRWANLRELRPARLGDLLRVHSFEYIQHLERTCLRLPAQSEACSAGTFFEHDPDPNHDHSIAATAPIFYPNEWMLTKHAKNVYATVDPPSGGDFDSDSPISHSSFLAARLAAGAVCHAIDKVMRGETTNAFVAVRPPGHHAGPEGCVESFVRPSEMCTCGFCLLNNVAIGAAYALTTYGGSYCGPPNDESQSSVYRPEVQRIAIVDFDIHHGNGTEEIVRNLVPHQQNIPVPSSWAPRSFASYKPWRDEGDVDNVFFASIHVYDGDEFYPGSGEGPHGDSSELRRQHNILNLPLDRLGPTLDDERRLTEREKTSLMERASRDFRNRIATRLVPALRDFKPDLVLLSAGFDGHVDDQYYFLTEQDYAWMTEQLVQVARECCDGRLVSVLEGGYNVEPVEQVPTQAQQPKSSKRQKAKATKEKTTRPKPLPARHSTQPSPSAAASPTRTASGGDGAMGVADHRRDGDSNTDPSSEQYAYGSLARSCAAHIEVLMRASSTNQ